MKYVSKENLEQYDTKLKEYINQTKEQLFDNYTYGIKWKTNQVDLTVEKTGNLELYKKAPIQEKFRNCIVKLKDKVEIQYYINNYYWTDVTKEYRHKLTYDVNVVNDNGICKVYSDVFKDLRFYDNNVNGNKIKSIDIENKFAIIDGNMSDGTYTVTFDAVLNGYDGEIMVDIPEFWIKSWDRGNEKEVRVSTVYIDDTWEHQPRILMSAAQVTKLNTIPENMGYLSTLPVDSVVCISNTNDYCRGGGYNAQDYDQYLETDPNRTMLGKPKTYMNNFNFRNYCKNTKAKPFNYTLYKNLYWLMVMDFGTFRTLPTFFPFVTQNKYYYVYMQPISPVYSRQSIWYGTDPHLAYNQSIFNKFTYEKNGTTYTQDTQPYLQYRWCGILNLFREVYTSMDGILFQYNKNNDTFGIYICKDPEKYSNTLNDGYEKIGTIENFASRTNNYILEFNFMNGSHIFPAETTNSLVKGKYGSFNITDNIKDGNCYSLNIGGHSAGNESPTIIYINTNNIGPQFAYRTIATPD